ncbi:hypothetical protein EPR50_G00071720 [Perca flavescens]|uniref:Uncharacterized protein n=1 Tax=Perca flavescens TaxID=8167 RepID=A0A484D4H2_PERFV|nr:hypothetical protein EPR50_G00071720 [Perca flavescens]
MYYLKTTGQLIDTEDTLPSCQIRTSAGSLPPSPSLSSPPTLVQRPDWMSSFEIPWQKMPANLRQCVAQGLRPRKQEHLSMVTTTAADINRSLSAPSTPRMIALGDSVLKANGWMLTVDGKVIIGPQELSDVDSALADLFSCFYSFNIQYQTEAENTLEFIQRFDHYELNYS